MFHVNMFRGKQSDLFINAACISGQAAAASDNSVAWDDSGGGFVSGSTPTAWAGMVFIPLCRAVMSAIAPYVMTFPYGTSVSVSHTSESQNGELCKMQRRG